MNVNLTIFFYITTIIYRVFYLAKQVPVSEGTMKGKLIKNPSTVS